MSIVLLCPTRARPEQLKRMMKSAASTSSGEIIIYCGLTGEECDHFDRPGFYKDYLACANEIYESTKKRVLIGTRFFPDGMPTAYKWNLLAEGAIKETHAETARSGINLFMLCADDVVFSTPCWDKALLDHYNALENKIHVYHLLDTRTGHGTPHPIVTREYIEAMGYFLPPLFLHWFVDTWTVEIAKSAGVFTHMTDYQLLHDKPSDVGKPDSTHTNIRQMGWHDRDKWTHEHCQHFLEFEKKRLQQAVVNATPLASRHEVQRKIGVM